MRYLLDPYFEYSVHCWTEQKMKERRFEDGRCGIEKHLIGNLFPFYSHWEIKDLMVDIFSKWDILREIFEIQKTVDKLMFSCRLKISFKGLN